MNDSVTSPHFLEKQQPLHPNSTRLNDKLQSQHLDIKEDDERCYSTLTRVIANCVGHVMTPRHVLGMLRLLKAVTFCFLILTAIADVMYMLFLEILANRRVRAMAGGKRDTVIRLYGLFLSIVAIAIETDTRRIVKKFSGLKSFFGRSFLIFFIAIITGSHPIHVKETKYAFDDYLANDDDANYYDTSSEIPTSAIGFQMVTSFVLYVLDRSLFVVSLPLFDLSAFSFISIFVACRGSCAIAYFICGLMCLDRFTSQAFMSNVDPRVTTAIEPPGERSQMQA